MSRSSRRGRAGRAPPSLVPACIRAFGSRDSGNRAGVARPGCPILSAYDVRHEDISDLVGRSSTSVIEPVYRHEIRSMLTKGATAMNRILKAKAAKLT